MFVSSELHHIRLRKHRKTKQEYAWTFLIYIDKKRISKEFSFKKYGGKETAFQKVKEYRDKYFQRNKIEVIIKDTSNEMTGVRRTMDKRWGTASWIAYWTIDNINYTEKFSVSKYGEEGAKEKAIQARKSAESAIEKEISTAFSAPSNKNMALYGFYKIYGNA